MTLYSLTYKATHIFIKASVLDLAAYLHISLKITLYQNNKDAGKVRLFSYQILSKCR